MPMASTFTVNLIDGTKLTTEEKQDLVMFLRAL
jgi:hypothetical protein